MGTVQTPASLATENPEGGDLIVAKVECPPQTPPFLVTLGSSRQNSVDVNCVGLFRWRERRGNLNW
ncbi:hypothetical protein DWX28_18605 [Blautia sp. AF19-10LB]|nr:hypothetical protein DWX28_18605 [Blautia sp. AF19-10LB]